MEGVAAGGDRPHPPGHYPVVVVGSGPGGLQTGYWLKRLGLPHALLSADDGPAGMFRKWPFFQRLITWTKPFAPVKRGTREYEWYDWNSLLADEPELRALAPGEMDGTSYFPSRPEMERGIAAFAGKAAIEVRYGCRWEGTRRLDDGRLAISTSDGEYTCRAAVFAVGTTVPWKPGVPGMEDVPHYAETRPVREYAGRRLAIIGKRNSGFELADGLLPWARQIVLLSPRPARISVLTHSTAAARARYLQPFEDHLLGGGTFVLDAAIERIERVGGGWRVHAAGTTRPGAIVLDADEVIAATGFTTPLRDLPDLGVAVFAQGRLPAQTHLWESPSAPGVFFAGSVTQGSIGLKKYGIPSNSAAVHGFRYNARILAEHLAETLGGWERPRPVVEAESVVPYLLREATRAPELWNQQSYLARVLTFQPDRGIIDDGIRPLAQFVDGTGPDAVAVAVETDADGDIHPAVYVRRGGRVADHVLPSDRLLDFTTDEHRAALAALLGDLMS
ncbi:MAG: NAD(P)-binding domain-containing protein [Actinobacteria bacterium]|nr:NAD(P)-binding domain-containing protein [Actinomycetota bacterium]